MTEAEWLAATDPTPMLAFLGDRVSERKLRLFVCACCRLCWDSLTDGRSRRAIEVNEAYADGMCSQNELKHARLEAYRGRADSFERLGNRRLLQDVSDEIYRATGINENTLRLAVWSFRYCAQEGLITPILADLFRDILGNPFRPVTADPSWLTTTVVSLAEGIYADRAFDRLPILADALQDAGCENADILSHCRSDGPHTRGCWVVDLLLGKE
jgi:hypothetical protein